MRFNLLKFIIQTVIVFVIIMVGYLNFNNYFIGIVFGGLVAKSVDFIDLMSRRNEEDDYDD